VQQQRGARVGKKARGLWGPHFAFLTGAPQVALGLLKKKEKKMHAQDRVRVARRAVSEAKKKP
jgi:hypothetical protein